MELKERFCTCKPVPHPRPTVASSIGWSPGHAQSLPTTPDNIFMKIKRWEWTKTFSALLGRPSQSGEFWSVRASTQARNWSLRIPSGILIGWVCPPTLELNSFSCQIFKSRLLSNSLTVADSTKLKSPSNDAGTKSFSRKLVRSLWSNSLSIFPP